MIFVNLNFNNFERNLLDRLFNLLYIRCKKCVKKNQIKLNNYKQFKTLGCCY